MRRNKQELYDKMGLNKRDVQLLNEYFDAFSNFYGRLPLKTAFEIVNEQNDNRFSEDILLKFAESKKREGRFYYIINPSDYYDGCDKLGALDQEIVNESLFAVDEEDYYDLCDAQEGKPVCVLPKDELLKYSDDFYREENADTLALEEFLEKNVKILQPPDSLGCTNTAKDMVDDYILGLTIDTSFEDLGIDDLLRLAKMPEDEEECRVVITKLIPLVSAVHNSTRMWANRGYTPTELGLLLGGPKPENLKTFVESLG